MQKFFVHTRKDIKSLQNHDPATTNLSMMVMLSSTKDFMVFRRRVVFIEKIDQIAAESDQTVLLIPELPSHGPIFKINGFWHMCRRGSRILQKLTVYQPIDKGTIGVMVINE